MNKKSETRSSSPYFPTTLSGTHTHAHTLKHIYKYIHSPSFLPLPFLHSFPPEKDIFLYGWVAAPLAECPSHLVSLSTASLLDTFPSGGCLTSSVAYKYTPLHESQPCHAKGACITQQSYKSCHEGPHKKMGHSEMF